jgi:hypothetical protein
MTNSFNTKKLWKHSFFCLIIVLCVAVLIFAGYVFCFFKIREIPPSPDCRNIIPHLKHGDVILRSGVGLWSELLREHNTVDKRFSHVGIVICGENGKFMVLHSEGDDVTGQGKVCLEPVEAFIAESDCIGISRLNYADPDKMADAAMNYLGRKFDWKFDIDDHDAIYCTELIALALQDSSDCRLKKTNGFIDVEACLDPEIFTEIIIP